ncbi:dTMP kinase [Fusobacterium russii]|uniref:dTMP kinase n=1 Tax=Fusobacterium russii TaxID=854 RepID=UPI00039FFFE9|nr:deoxynucleoside kinase [Fusobacterium russii]
MGKIIVIEGTDSSGKETQTKLLYERIKKLYNRTIKISFPNYKSPACEPVKMYLAGEFGKDATKINPYPVSTMYAIDRYASFKQNWEKFYRDNYIIITDRYVTSNMIHQASKIEDRDKKEEYLKWLEDLEYEKIEIPRPDEVIFLKMPIDKAKILMEERKNKITGEEKKDIHELNEEYLKKSYDNACLISKKYSWTEIECVENSKIKTIEQINNEIFEKVKRFIEKE